MDTPKNADDLLDVVISLHPGIRWNNPGLLNTRLDWLMACDKVKKRGTLYCLSPIIQDDKETMVGHYRQNLNIGEIGEQYVLADEKESLWDYPHLAKRVRRVSLYAPRAGYDILSYFPDGRLKFIEVKATPGEDTHFEMTHNEWLTAKRFGDSYFVYRVTNINNKPNIVRIQNPAANLTRRPLVWKMNYAKESNPDSLESLTVREKDLQRQLQMETILQELPIEENVIVSRRNRTWPQKLYIKREEDYQWNNICPVCLGEDKEIILVSYFIKNRSDGIAEYVNLNSVSIVF
ncbi:MAG: hypothetical protein APF81_24950 [Desulfosporosinus sp. BRH_c37]|nr:MAG: hypothetical protein APF81_24950 [Desulfosporosinus sp. BRH_c37]